VASAFQPTERRGTKECDVIRVIAALALASASAHPTATLTSSAPWWERVTVTVADDGTTRSCRYETSLQPQAAQDCSVQGGDSAKAQSAGAKSGAKDQYTAITFERRFTPGDKPDSDAVRPGETLLSGRVMALAIDAHGAVKGCHVVSTSGSVTPQYGCSDAAAERFEASAGTPRAAASDREGFMTVLVYGHSEHIV
jgi:hypothetical protein